MPKLAASSPYTDQGKLSERDYTAWQKTYGQNYKKMETELVQNDSYQKLSADDKVYMLGQIKELAGAISKEEFKDDAQDKTYEYNFKNYKKQYEAYQKYGMDGLLDYYDMKSNMDGKTGTSATIKAIERAGITGQEALDYFKQQNEAQYSNQAKLLDQINPQYAYDWYKVISNAGGTSKADREFAIVNSNLPDEEKKVLLDVNNAKADEIKQLLGK